MSVEIGSYLRQARESIGLSLEQLQNQTKIQKSFLIAIENGEFHKLPSPFYVRSYLRSYANQVKVEPHHILRQYRKEEQAERYQTGQYQVKQLEQQLKQTRRLSPQNTGRMSVITGLDLTNPQVANRNSALTVAVTASSHDTNKQKKVTNNTSSFRTEKTSALSATRKQPTTSKKSVEPDPSFGRKEKEALPSQTRPNRILSVTDTQPTVPVKNENTSPKIKQNTIPPSRQKQATAKNEMVVAENTSSGGLSRVSRMRQEQDDMTTTASRRKVSQNQVSIIDRILMFVKGKPKILFLAAFAVAAFGLAYIFFPGGAEESSQGPEQEAVPETNTNNTDVSSEQNDPDSTDKEASVEKLEPGEYVVTNTQKAVINFDVVEGDVWIQIRNSREASGEYIEDFTLSSNSGSSYQYSHEFTDSQKDLYISIGTPTSVKMTVNGIPITPEKLLHIENKP